MLVGPNILSILGCGDAPLRRLLLGKDHGGKGVNAYPGRPS